MLYCHTASALAACKTPEAKRNFFQVWYDSFIDEHGREPGVVTVHLVYEQYGGPEEGGWYYQVGVPVLNYCVFSKTQAIDTLLQLAEEYIADTEDEDEYALDLSSEYGKFYPETRPHYE